MESSRGPPAETLSSLGLAASRRFPTTTADASGATRRPGAARTPPSSRRLSGRPEPLSKGFGSVANGSPIAPGTSSIGSSFARATRRRPCSSSYCPARPDLVAGRGLGQRGGELDAALAAHQGELPEVRHGRVRRRPAPGSPVRMTSSSESGCPVQSPVSFSAVIPAPYIRATRQDAPVVGEVQRRRVDGAPARAGDPRHGIVASQDRQVRPAAQDHDALLRRRQLEGRAHDHLSAVVERATCSHPRSSCTSSRATAPARLRAGAPRAPRRARRAGRPRRRRSSRRPRGCSARRTRSRRSSSPAGRSRRAARPAPCRSAARPRCARAAATFPGVPTNSASSFWNPVTSPPVSFEWKTARPLPSSPHCS